MADTDTAPPRRTGPHAPLPTPNTLTLKGTAASATPELDENDPRVRAARRAAELRESGTYAEGAEHDKFYIDPAIIPDGWTYQWRAHSVLGKIDPSYQVTLARGGWAPVPLSRHPFLMPNGWPGDSIEREGQILMERPTEINREREAFDRGEARRQMREKQEQLAGAPPGTFERAGRAAIKQSYEPLPANAVAIIPKE